MINRSETLIQLLTMTNNVRDRMWIAAMARQTLSQVSATMVRNLADLGYDSIFGTGYNGRFYGLSQVARRPSSSMSWGFDAGRMRLDASEVTWRHVFGLVANSHNSSNCMLCLRNGPSSAVSWIEDPSTNLLDYVNSTNRNPENMTIQQAYNSDVLPKVMEVLAVFGGVCMAQAFLYGPEVRAIPDMSDMIVQLNTLLDDGDKVILHKFLEKSASARLLCRSYVHTMENANADGSTAVQPVGDANVPAAEVPNPAQPVSGSVTGAPV